jgi:hypothetical protein
MEPLIVLAIILVAMVLAWKFLAGLIKTVVLVAILAAAAIFVFGAMG